MTGIAILDVAIGLVLVYLLLGLLCMLAAEWIAQIRRLRARTLRHGIEALLNDTKYKRVTDNLYRHPLIAGLRQGERDPSYIPGTLFAKAFLAETEKKLAAIGNDLSPGSFIGDIDRIVEKYEQLKIEVYKKGQIVGQRLNEAKQVLEQLRQRERTLRKGGAADAEVATAQNQLSTGEEVGKNAQREYDDYVRDYLGYTGSLEEKLAQLEAEQYCYRDLAEVLKSFVGATGTSLVELESHLAGWYDAAMARVSGWYRRKLAMIVLGAAAAAALLFNADTIGMARTVWFDGEIRDVIRRAADVTAQRCSLQEIRAGDNPACSIDVLLQTIEARRRLPVGWYADAMPVARTVCPEGDAQRRARDEARRIADDRTRQADERTAARARLTRAEDQLALACSPRPADYGLWLAGILLSIGAIWFAALFWFDVLKRFVNLRGSGRPARS
ncbi:MAG: hypothetical protein KIT16_04915 [Rhodospirillaceae bacterium]|nr:hypothetical protein [Rhodospirillaceae bacterium]